jgi:hypothetical protein
MTDPVDAVILALLDHLDGSAPRPTLDHLGPGDRARAQMLVDGLVTARGLDPWAARPSLERLLADTPFAGLVDHEPAVMADLAALVQALRGVDERVWIELDADTVVLSYLDLRARFLLVEAAEPRVSGPVRAQVRARFAADPDTSRVGVVAGLSPDLTTQLLAPDDLAPDDRAPTVTAPHGRPHLGWELPLPLPLAARRLLEQCAPQWPAFDLGLVQPEPLDLAMLAGDIAHRVIGREAGRPYRGRKRQAYLALLGQEQAVADLVALVGTRGAQVDLDRELTRIARAAA